jgi:hypothetical protein
MFGLHIKEHTFTYEGSEVKGVFLPALEEVMRNSPSCVVKVLRGDPPKAVLWRATLGFAIDGKVYWLPPECLDGLEDVIYSAGNGVDRRFSIRRDGSIDEDTYVIDPKYANRNWPEQ